MSEKFEVMNPFTDKVYTSFEMEDFISVESKIQKLKVGREKLEELSTFNRSLVLNKLADLLEKNSKDFISMIVQEIGKTNQDVKVEIARAAATLRVSAIECTQLNGEVISSDHFGMTANKRGLVEWKPMGTLLAITPFNFPINLAVHKIGPAFGVGNTILFKPHPQNYLSGKKLVELCYEAGMTDEMIQFIMPTNETMAKVVSHDDISLISLTGGIRAAEAISKSAGMKKMLFELGGNDPLILMPDGNLDKAVQTCLNQRFGTAGQRCTASKRIFIHADVYEEFKTKVLAATKELVIGDPSDPKTFVGPVVNKQAADDVMRVLDDAVNAGADVLHGHKREGNLIHPTILENIPTDAEVICEETFGPVLPLIKFTDIDEVISTVNKASYGLQSGVFTRDIELIKKLYNKLEVGALIVDDGPGFRAEHFPFGGVKKSGIGSEGVRYTMREMAHRKTLVL